MGKLDPNLKNAIKRLANLALQGDQDATSIYKELTALQAFERLTGNSGLFVAKNFLDRRRRGEV